MDQNQTLIGYNLLKEIGAVIDTEIGIMRYGGKKEKLIYDNDSSFTTFLIRRRKHSSIRGIYYMKIL